MSAAERSVARSDPPRTPSAVLPVVMVLLALAAVALTRPPEPPGGVGPTGAATGGLVELVDHTAFACPDQDAGERVDTAVRLGLAPAQTGMQLAGGTVRQGPAPSVGRPVEVPRGSLVDLPATGGPAVDATGGAAVGLFGFRTDVEKRRTLGVSACAAPRSTWWFTGAGAGLDHSSTLLLANLDPGPVVLDLTVLGPDGPVDTVARGVSMAPHSVKRVRLSEIAPQTDDLALGVHTSRGRVVASVTDSYRARLAAPRGQEWLSATDLPSRTVLLAGLPVVSGSSALLVANPSDLEAVVEVRVAARSGSFAPLGLEEVTVAPGAVARVDLGPALRAKEAVALRLRSRVPVVASVRSTEGRDHSYATAVLPLLGPAVAPLVPGAVASVQLSAGAVAAKVGLTAYDAAGKRVDRTTLSIGAGATRVWSPEQTDGYVVCVPSTGPGDGTVHGAVTYAGDGLAAVPLTPLPLRVERPVVRPGLG